MAHYDRRAERPHAAHGDVMYARFLRDPGWGLCFIPDAIPSFGFTCGLSQDPALPEMLVVGFDAELTHYYLNNLAVQQRRGLILEEGDLVGDPDIPYKLKVRYVDIPDDGVGYPGVTVRLLGREFKYVQLLWCDTLRRYPGDEGFEGNQPLLPARYTV